jgi:elongator complex protein 3
LKDHATVNPANLQTICREYQASDGRELFISEEDPDCDVLIGYIRLRIPSTKATRDEVDRSAALVRELHVYGPEVPIGKHHRERWQHLGFGRKLLVEAEQRASEDGAKKVLVLSALGTKEYYRRAGYRTMGPYMCKEIN